MTNPAKRAHSILSASGASRWLNCLGSARLQENFGVDYTSAYALEGTLAHEMSENFLRFSAGQIDLAAYKRNHSKLKQSEFYSPEMPDEIRKYTDQILERLGEASKNDPSCIFAVEQRYDLSRYVPDGVGTCDSVIIHNDTLEIDDLKYGTGVRVYAEHNPQLMLYALGAMTYFEPMFGTFSKVVMRVHQPRLDNHTTFSMSGTDLVSWGEQEVIPKAEKAFAGSSSFVTGAWCQFCTARAVCTESHEATIVNAQKRFTMEGQHCNTLPDETIENILDLIPALKAQIKAVEGYALATALDGKKWTRYKVIEGSANRQWIDESETCKLLALRFKESEFLATGLLGIGDITKLIGAKEVATMLYKPVGKPALVPIDHPQEALNPNEQAKKIFETKIKK